MSVSCAYCRRVFSVISQCYGWHGFGGVCSVSQVPALQINNNVKSACLSEICDIVPSRVSRIPYSCGPVRHYLALIANSSAANLCGNLMVGSYHSFYIFDIDIIVVIRIFLRCLFASTSITFCIAIYHVVFTRHFKARCVWVTTNLFGKIYIPRRQSCATFYVIPDRLILCSLFRAASFYFDCLMFGPS